MQIYLLNKLNIKIYLRIWKGMKMMKYRMNTKIKQTK